jgi:hypothetical protein
MWDIRMEIAEREDVSLLLQRMGQAGFELVSVVFADGKYSLFFQKRTS